jgi:pimeloyl-ACP methyl ester carboxylesterase
VLEGSATNAEEWAASRIPWYAKPFIKVTIADNLKTFDNLDVVKNHKAPLLVLVGEKDARTPKVLSKRLFQNSVSQVRVLHIFEDGLHEILDHPELGDVYRDFVFNKLTQ